MVLWLDIQLCCASKQTDLPSNTIIFSDYLLFTKSLILIIIILFKKDLFYAIPVPLYGFIKSRNM